jgi:hypothetical protein
MSNSPYFDAADLTRAMFDEACWNDAVLYSEGRAFAAVKDEGDARKREVFVRAKEVLDQMWARSLKLTARFNKEDSRLRTLRIACEEKATLYWRHVRNRRRDYFAFTDPSKRLG